MILMRLNDLEGLFCSIQGGQDKYKYNKSNAGWFPIESMNFGFKTATDSSSGGSTGDSQNQSGGSSAGGNSSPPAPPKSSGGTGSGGAKKENEDAFSTISISKFVDGVSSSLMGFAMRDRLVSKSDEQKQRKADIHFLHSVKSLDKEDRFIFPYLMITLQKVLIRGWNITASGDDRPSESMELWYDKAAMRYYRTIDGKEWIGGQITSWDQYKNDEWQNVEAEAPYFAQPDF